MYGYIYMYMYIRVISRVIRGVIKVSHEFVLEVMYIYIYLSIKRESRILLKGLIKTFVLSLSLHLSREGNSHGYR